MDSQQALAGLEEARAGFVAAIEVVPPEALAFRQPGDDYSLGGLIAHNIGVLQHYRLVLGDVVAGGFTETRPQDPPGFWEQVGEQAKAPLAPGDRDGALSQLAQAHADFAGDLAAVPEPDWGRSAPVFYGDATEAHWTTVGDILGWVRDHYHEHVPHVEQLAEAWRTHPR